MKKITKALTGLFAGTFAILFVVTAAFALVLYNVEQSVFDAMLYIQAFEKENVYRRLPDLAAQSLHKAAQESIADDPLALFRNYSKEEWEEFLSKILPPEELKILAEDSITQVMAYLNGESTDAVISLVHLKAHLQSPQGISAIFGILKTQPNCTPEQLAAITTGQQELMLCNPPESILFLDLTPIIESEIEAAVALMVPEKTNLIPANSNRIQELQDLNNLRTIIRLSPLLPMLCLLMVTGLTVRSPGDWLNWWGFPLWFGGLFSLALSIVSGLITVVIFQAYVAPVFPETFPPDILDMLEDIVATIAYEAVQPMVLVAGIIALIGMIMVVIANLFRKRLRKNQSSDDLE